MSTEELMEQLSSKLILVIDDQSSMRSVVKSYFKDMGFDRIETAIDGKDGMNLLMQNAVDLVVCDWHMPKISGLELLKIVRLNEETKNLPFLMVTSTADITAVKSALESGVSDYMIKPFQPAQLGFKAIKLLTSSSHKAMKLPVKHVSSEAEYEQVKPGSDDHDGTPVDIEEII